MNNDGVKIYYLYGLIYLIMIPMDKIINNITSMSVETILDKIIKPEYRAKLSNWESYAKPIDLFGLECINEIYNTKGAKRLRTNEPVYPQQQMLNTKSSFFGETDAKMYSLH